VETVAIEKPSDQAQSAHSEDAIAKMLLLLVFTHRLKVKSFFHKGAKLFITASSIQSKFINFHIQA
jgi:hypothetical protein